MSTWRRRRPTPSQAPLATRPVPRHPRYDPELRRKALAAYREHRTYKAAGQALGLSPKRTHELVREGLKAELAAAQRARKDLAQ